MLSYFIHYVLFQTVISNKLQCIFAPSKYVINGKIGCIVNLVKRFWSSGHFSYDTNTVIMHVRLISHYNLVSHWMIFNCLI